MLVVATRQRRRQPIAFLATALGLQHGNTFSLKEDYLLRYFASCVSGMANKQRWNNRDGMEDVKVVINEIDGRLRKMGVIIQYESVFFIQNGHN